MLLPNAALTSKGFFLGWLLSGQWPCSIQPEGFVLWWGALSPEGWVLVI